MQRARRALRRDNASLPIRQRQDVETRHDAARQPPRRTQQSRSRAARELLLNATIEVLIDRGYNGLTTKEVAARAGFSSGALVHHYRTKAELVIAATAHVYDRCIEHGRKIAASKKALRHPVRAYIDECLRVYLGWPFVAAVEVLIPARTDQTLMAQVNEFMRYYRQTMNEIWLDAFVRAGVRRDEASFLMMTTLNMVRGMGINSMWQRNMPHYKNVLRQWADVIEAGALKGRHCELR